MSEDTQSRLVQMANDIGNFFRALPDRDEAIAGIASHIKSYWTPKMREKLIAQMEGTTDLDELPRAAMQLLMSASPKAKAAPVGGDAG